MRRAGALGVVALLGLGACPGGRAPGAGAGAAAAATAASGACPARPAVRVAAMGAGGRWELHEKIVPWEGEQLFTGAAAEEDGRRELDAATARHFGATSTEAPVWLFVAPDAPPCAATPRGWAAIHGGDGARHTRVVRLLDGCVPAEPDRVFDVYALQEPGAEACRWARPQILSQKLDDGITGSLPAALAARVPACGDGEACAAPGVEERWTAQVIAVPGGPRYYEILHSRVYHVAGVDECDWEVDSWFARFVEPTPGAPLADWGDEGWHTGVLYAGDEARALVADDTGSVWVSYPETDGRVSQPAQRFEWYLPNEEDSLVKSLGPYCGP